MRQLRREPFSSDQLQGSCCLATAITTTAATTATIADATAEGVSTAAVTGSFNSYLETAFAVRERSSLNLAFAGSAAAAAMQGDVVSFGRHSSPIEFECWPKPSVVLATAGCELGVAALGNSEAVIAGSKFAVNTPVRVVAKSLTAAAQAPFAAARILRMTSYAAVLAGYTSTEQSAVGFELQHGSRCEYRRMTAAASTASELTVYQVELALWGTYTQDYAEAVLQVRLKAMPGKGWAED